ncbi:MAG: formate dehydrogenase, partial [Rhodobacterales bacterium]|nr:formate dehydrogenase [Rhodobacterales bacterium]
MKVWLPRDAAARALGADAVARALADEAARRGVTLDLIRTGSRGMVWLEPLVEVERDGVRHGLGSMTPDQVAQVFDGGPLALGPVDALPWMARQTRLTFARVGVIDPLSLTDYQAQGGLTGLRRALATDPAQVRAQIAASGLRGRG